MIATSVEQFLFARGRERLLRSNPEAATWSYEKIRSHLTFDDSDVAAAVQAMITQHTPEKLR